MDPLSRSLLRRRIDTGRILAWGMVGLLAAGYAYLQLVRSSDLGEKAQNQAVKNLLLRAPRGILYDRNGHKLVENRPAMDLVILKEDLPKDAGQVTALATALGLEPDPLLKRIQGARKESGTPVVTLQTRLDDAGLAAAEMLRARFPFLSVIVVPSRAYLGSTLAGHALGYVGEVSPDLMSQHPGKYQMGEVIGVSGFEASHNDLIKGRDGIRQVLVDNLNRIVSVQGTQDPKPGTSVVMTLDAGLQQVLQDAFGQEHGAAVVLDLKDGGILGMYSAPSLDPNIFMEKQNQKIADMWADPAKPMEHRAIRGRYAPGSTFKLFMALAALDAGKLRPDEVIHCSGAMTYGGTTFKCEHVHGGVSLIPAIAQSCNVFFYTLGSRLDIDDIYKAAERYGLAGLTGVDLPSEKACRIPNREYKARMNKRNPANQKWFPGETISVAIGQGDVGLTPMGLARFYGMLGTKGRLLTPHLLLGKRDDVTGALLPEPPPPAKQLDVNPKWLALLDEGLYQVVAAGTAKACRIPGLDMVGKTGTAQVRSEKDKAAYAKFEKKFKNHAWFAGYAPRENPQIAFCVLAENAGFGAASAAPIAKKVCEYWFLQRPKNPLPPPGPKPKAQPTPPPPAPPARPEASPVEEVP